jgi:hypothetical protein
VALVEVARAQARTEALVLVVPPLFQIPPGTEAAFPIQVRPAGAMPKRALILIRGLPNSIALSQGRLFESGVWGIPATEINALKISSTTVAVGRSDLSVSLVAMDGTLLAEARSSLAIGASAVPTVARPDRTDTAALRSVTPQEQQPLRDAAPLVKRLTAEQTEQLLAIVKKGDEQMRVGNVSAARLLYRHAAESGLGAGALALAATYDAHELAKHRVLGGVQSDPREAQIWYERARDLGSAEARERLVRLGAR